MIVQPKLCSEAAVTARQDPWFAVKVRMRSEKMAVTALQEKGFSPFAPSVHCRRRYSDRIKLIETPVFPGYVFCQCKRENKSALLNTTAVAYIVSFGGTPAEVPEREIESVRAVLSAGGQAYPFFSCGDRVTVKSGPLAGVEGLIVKRGNKHDFVVSINLLQRSISVALDEESLIP